jgi:hypothetical protein
MSLKIEGRSLAMRLEATVPTSRGEAVDKLSRELGLSRSQLIDEALALFLKAVHEIQQGRRLCTVDPKTSMPACELATPTLSAIEWALKSEHLELPTESIQKMKALIDAPAEPNERLRAAARALAKQQR